MTGITRQLFRPHLTTSPDRIVAEEWVLEGGEVVPDRDPLKAWDPTVDVTLTRQLLVDRDGVCEDCGLDPRADLAIASVWVCPATSLRGAMAVPLPQGTDYVRVSVRIPGREITDRIVVRSQLILAVATEAVRTVVAPRRSGAILWEDSREIVLEGEGSRFPTEWIDFGLTSWLASRAGWYLDWSPDDPGAPVLAAMRLYLNSSNDAIREAVSASEPTEAAVAIREAIIYDVARTILGRAFSSETFWHGHEEAEEGTTGAVVRSLLATYFPNDTTEGLQARWRDDPGRVEAQLQAALSLFARVVG